MSVQKVLLGNKYLLKGLEKISEHGASFGAGTALAMSTFVRPAAILMTPDVDKENKQYACANSICSGAVKFGLVASVAIPIENAVKNIDKNAQKYLTPNTVKSFCKEGQALKNSRSYNLATQMIKLSTGVVTAIPKSMLTIALIPVIMDKVFKLKKDDPNVYPIKALSNNNDEKKEENKSSVTFSGRYTEMISKGISKILNAEAVQKFANKHQKEDKNIAMHMTAGTDILLTSTFAYQTAKSDEIKENRKKALIYNNVIATGVTVAGGYSLDKMIKKGSSNFLQKFSQINKGDPKLHKYIEGINILRPTLIFAGIYYGILPMFSTFIADKVDKFIVNKQKQKTQNDAVSFSGRPFDKFQNMLIKK